MSGATMAAQLAADALMMAIRRRGNRTRCRAANVWDNAAMESFFASLKTDWTARTVYRTRDQARADVFDYIARFYSRRHSTVGYLSPMECERIKAPAQATCPSNRQNLSRPAGAHSLLVQH